MNQNKSEPTAKQGYTECEFNGVTYAPRQIWKLVDSLYARGIILTLNISEDYEIHEVSKWQAELEVTDGVRYGNNPAYCQSTVYGEGKTAFDALASAIENL